MTIFTIFTILVMTHIKYKGTVLRYLKLDIVMTLGDDYNDDYHGGGDDGDGDAYLIGNGKVVKGKMRRRHCCFDSLRIL